MDRKEIENKTIHMIKGNSFFKPDLYRVEIEGKAIMVKDVRKKNFFYRWTLGAWLIKKELKTYSRLAGIKGIPKVFGRVDRFAFAMEYINGKEIRRGENFHPSFFRELERILNEIHARNVFHLDLRHKGNILVSESGEPFIIDFNSSLSLKGRGLPHCLLSPLLRNVDYGGFLKLKERVSPSLMTPEEISFLKKINFLRKLWLFK